MKTGFLIALLVCSLGLMAQTPIITYYDDGSIKEKYHILDNDSSKVDGLYEMYSPLGNVIITGHYEKGKRQGESVLSHPG